MADGLMGLDDPLAGLDTTTLFGPSVLGGNFGTPNTDVSMGSGADAPWLFNGPSNSVFGNSTPTVDFMSNFPSGDGSAFDLNKFLDGLGGVGGLFQQGLSSLSGLLPDQSTALRTLPGAMALGYAASQPSLDLGPLNAIQGQLAGNQNAVIKAATDPVQMNIASGYGDLLQSQALRGIRGSSFGDTDIANYLATTGNTLANAGSNAAQGSLALQGNLAGNVAQLQNQRQQMKNSLYGTAFDVLGRGLNPTGYSGTTNINVGGGGAAQPKPQDNGLFGTGISSGDVGAVATIASLFSDRRLKTNVVKIADDPRGFGVYEYDFLGDRQWGVMADEVEEVMPEAVSECLGYKTVDYGRLYA